MKKYEELQLMIVDLGNLDVITWSNSQDNDVEDVENWYEG